MRMQLAIGPAIAVFAVSSAAWAQEPVRCTTDALGAETCRYADGTTTRRLIDKLGYETFRDRDGATSRRKVQTSGTYVEVNGRGKVVERCHYDDHGHVMCDRRPR